MGKLSPEDWRAVDRDLRGEAIEILRELDRLEGALRPGRRARAPALDASRRDRTDFNSAITFATKISANATVQRLRLRSTSEPPPNGPAPVPTPNAPESPESLPECSRMSTIRITQRIT